MKRILRLAEDWDLAPIKLNFGMMGYLVSENDVVWTESPHAKEGRIYAKREDPGQVCWFFFKDGSVHRYHVSCHAPQCLVKRPTAAGQARSAERKIMVMREHRFEQRMGEVWLPPCSDDLSDVAPNGEPFWTNKVWVFYVEYTD